MTRLADIHCHILPYVDDGAAYLEEAVELLEMQTGQGVNTMCFTPHFRRGMFESTDEEVLRQFQRLRQTWREKSKTTQLFLSREYHWDANTQRKLYSGEIMPLGNGNTMLVEFSNHHTMEDIRTAVGKVLEAGYQPLIAHAERYTALRQDIEGVKELIGLGAKIQMNAGSILGREGFRQKRFSIKLIRESLVHAVASDAHDPYNRPPELDKCFQYLTRKTGREQAEKLLYQNPLNILQTTDAGGNCYAGNQADQSRASL